MRLSQRTQHRYHNQRGVALAISLVLLAGMTLLGVATLSGTRLNERIASNTQQKSISFEAAESSIKVVWDVAKVLEALDAIPVGEFNDPVPITSSAIDAELSSGLDQTATSGSQLSIDITASVSMQYCGETSLPTGSSLNADESGIQFAGTVMDVNGTAEIAGSHAKSDHIQRGYVIRPKTGRTGDCWIPDA